MAALVTTSIDGDVHHGQITIFSLTSCRHCLKAKRILGDKGWPFVDIPLDLYPTAKTSMLQLSDRLTVPQIFFNDHHVGGSQDLEAMDLDGSLAHLYESMRGTNAPRDKRFQRPEIDPVEPKEPPALTESSLCIGGRRTTYGEVFATITGAQDKTFLNQLGGSEVDVGLGVKELPKGSTGAKSILAVQRNVVFEEMKRVDSDEENANESSSGGSTTHSGDSDSSSSGASEDSHTNHVSDSGSTTDSDSGEGQPASPILVSKSARESKASPKSRIGAKVLDIRDRKYYLQTYRSCFFGSDLVDVLLDRYDLRGGREEARQVAKMLFDAKMFRHVSNEHTFEDSTKYFYRMTAHEEPLVLNSWRVWNDRVDMDSLAIVSRCNSVLKEILNKHRSKEGLIKYDDVAADNLFQEFEEMTCEIQAVDLSKLDTNERLAFTLNLYNMMVKHAFAKVGRPETVMKRDAFFSNVSYNIGGLIYSLSDLENGVLRGNKRPPGFHISKPFGVVDPRLASVLHIQDPRIHFALNCGAKSCPPVKVYSALNVQEELRVVALAFCELDSNVHVDVESKCLSCSKIFYWYGNDFGLSTEEILDRIGKSWLRGEKKANWNRVLKSGKYRYRKVSYDWTTDAEPSSKIFQGVPRGK